MNIYGSDREIIYDENIKKAIRENHTSWLKKYTHEIINTKNFTNTELKNFVPLLKKNIIECSESLLSEIMIHSDNKIELDFLELLSTVCFCIAAKTILQYDYTGTVSMFYNHVIEIAMQRLRLNRNEAISLIDTMESTVLKNVDWKPCPTNEFVNIQRRHYVSKDPYLTD
jgi:hypothetical protein